MAERYLVLGGLGLVGRAVVDRLADDGREVIAVGRRTPESDDVKGATWLSVDLTDRAACHRTFSALGSVTHIVYCALYERPDLIAGWRDAEQIATNETMLRNVLDAVEPERHLTLLQGTKAYAAHLRPMSLPGKESSARPPGANFYWNQEDLVRERSGAWQFTILRPQIVCGWAEGSPMNMVAAIGALAALQDALGDAFGFPGTDGFVTEATDADLLARAVLWAGRNDIASGETYNVTNGDVIHWPSIWPDLAAALNVGCGEPRRMSLAARADEFEALWPSIAERHNLRRRPLKDLLGSSWQFADAVFGYAAAATTLLSTVKIRQHGFADCVDSSEMFARYFQRLRDERWLP